MDLEIAASAFPLLSHCRLFACAGTRIRSSQGCGDGTEQRWALFDMWAEACWQGQVDRVIEQLSTLRDGLGPLCEEEAESLADMSHARFLPRSLVICSITGIVWTTHDIASRDCLGRAVTWSRR